MLKTYIHVDICYQCFPEFLAEFYAEFYANSLKNAKCSNGTEKTSYKCHIDMDKCITDIQKWMVKIDKCPHLFIHIQAFTSSNYNCLLLLETSPCVLPELSKAKGFTGFLLITVSLVHCDKWTSCCYNSPISAGMTAGYLILSIGLLSGIHILLNTFFSNAEI